MQLERSPVAFLSYVRSDDDHDSGAITAFRKRLEGEIRMHTGEPFPIFQDRNDIAWGQHWHDRITKSIETVTFLIPFVTPSFFRSRACLEEFEAFRLKEELLGANRLILPVYYVTARELDDNREAPASSPALILKERQWTDWRPLRFKSLDAEVARVAMAALAETVGQYVAELRSIKDAQERDLNRPVSASKSEAPARTTRLRRRPSERISDNPPVERSPALAAKGKSSPSTESAPYKVFTREFDEIVSAESLFDDSTIDDLFRYLDSQRRNFELARRVEYLELETQLSRATIAQDTSVTLLVDNSGSLRGPPSLAVGVALLNLIESFDRIGAPLEILGFTTRAWKGGRSREKWTKKGRAKNPGRLNDLRHILYKTFSQSSISVARNIGIIVREGLLKENIDGEAVEWAAGRLLEWKSERKLLIVLSDGAPVDDSTQSANDPHYLERHLKTVLGNLSEKGLPVSAVGLGHNVERYYPGALFSSKLDDIDLLVLEKLMNAVSDQTSRT